MYRGGVGRLRIAGTLILVGAFALAAWIDRAGAPSPVWVERQWSAADSAGAPARERLTAVPGLRSPYYSLLIDAERLTVEWRAFLFPSRPERWGVRAVAGGDVEVSVAGRPVIDARCPAGCSEQAVVDVPAGPVEVVARTAVANGRGGFRGYLARGDEVRAFEALPVSSAPDPARLTAWWVGLLGFVAAAAALSLARSSDPSARRSAELAATLVLVAALLAWDHGPGLRFWGSFLWEHASIVATVSGLAAVFAVCLVVPRIRLPRPPPWLIAAGTVVVTWFLRDRMLWGDGRVTVALLEGRHPEGPFGAFFWKEPLDRVIAVLATHLADFGGIGAREAVAATSCLAAGWAAWTLARAGTPAVTAGLVATAGAALLFFGHVENYTWVTAALVAFFVSATEEPERPIRTGALGGLAISFHPLAVFQVLPALVVFVVRRPRPHSVRALCGLAAIPALLVASAVALGVELPALGPDRFADDPDVWLGPSHWLDAGHLSLVVNRFVAMLSPGILVGLAMIRGARPVLLAAVAGAVLHVLALHGKLEPAVLDWDLYAPAFVPFAFLAGDALAREGDRRRNAWVVGVSAIGVISYLAA